MIVKDEAENLEACLGSVADVADEIVVVDTGSTDGSQEIVRRFGGQVYEHPWEDDFSKHRNQSLSYARGAWILQIDADETLTQESTPNLRDLLQGASADVHGFMTRIENVNRHGRRNAVFHYPRLFRNDIGVHYRSSVHNQVVIPGRIEPSEIVLRHHGYDLDRRALDRKVSRTEALLLSKLEREPEDLSALCNLAHTYSMAGRPERAVAVGERAIRLLRNTDSVAPAFLGVYYPTVTSHIMLGNLQKALRLCRDGLEKIPWYVDLHYQRTRVLAKTHQYVSVLPSGDAYHEAREMVVADPSRMMTLTFYTLDLAFRVDYWQGLASLAVGDWQRADHHLCRALNSPELTFDTTRELYQNLERIEQNDISERWVEKCLHRYPAIAARKPQPVL
jgi:glycosyltransferase involved in cell wall biosynthesis